MVTDLPEFVELMECNIEQNRDCITGTVTAKALKYIACNNKEGIGARTYLIPLWLQVLQYCVYIGEKMCQESRYHV